MPPKGPKAAPKAGGKKGPPNAMLAKLKMKMEMQAAEEERFKKEAEEEERRIREEERLAEEQRRFEEEQRQKDKERQKEAERLARKEQKKEGTSNAMERMRAAGFILPDVDRIREEQRVAKEKAAAEPPKPRPKPAPKVAPQQQHKDPEAVEEEEESEDDGELTEATESDVEIDEDDWEAVDERDERRKARHETNIRVRAERETRKTEKKAQKEAAKQKAEEERRAAGHTLEAVSNLRSPICCILGHVDTGKTSLLDRLRRTNVQGGEAGGITQQIGATFFPHDAILKATGDLNDRLKYNIDVPGLLLIDTPGHESFTNLRSRGTSLCDIAVLVVDVMHGLEQQTIESIALLQKKKCPFIIALNKIDRLYDWEVHENMDFQQSLSKQKSHVKSEFATRLGNLKSQLAGKDGKIQLENKTAKDGEEKKGPRRSVEATAVQAEVYYDNTNDRKVFSIVPISAKTGEGISDLLLLQVKLVQQFMEGKVTYKDDLQCTVLEVKPTVGHGFTMDCILINGELHENDQICLCGSQEQPIFTTIRSLLTPQPMRESRVGGDYIHHKSIKAAMGVKIAANDLEYVVPGTSVILVRPGDDKEKLGKEVMRDASSIADRINADGMGIMVQSSTMGGLEALLSFLDANEVPVSCAGVGPIHKKHLHQILAMKRKEPRFATILAFDVPISADAEDIVKKNNIKYFASDTIYRLLEMFERDRADWNKQELARLRDTAIYPVQLRIIDDAIHATNPIIIPVTVERGRLLKGTPLCAIKGENTPPVMVGRVLSIQKSNKDVERAEEGEEVAVKINSTETNVTFGRQFVQKDPLVSAITRPSVDAIKRWKEFLTPQEMQKELPPDDINLLATLIKLLKVPK